MPYKIANDKKSILCLSCGMRSFNQVDVAQRYCGQCHKFHNEGMVCDFCNQERPLVKDYKTTSRIIGKLPDGRTFVDDDQIWGACQTCFDLIDAEKWDELLDCAVEGTMVMYPTEDRASVRQNCMVVLKIVLGESVTFVQH